MNRYSISTKHRIAISEIETEAFRKYHSEKSGSESHTAFDSGLFRS